MSDDASSLFVRINLGPPTVYALRRLVIVHRDRAVMLWTDGKVTVSEDDWAFNLPEKLWKRVP